jgi:hypothetical protein
MRNNRVMLIGAAALLVIGGAAFQAQATIGGGTHFLAPAPYSLFEKASCSGQGLFCRSGSTLQCNPICTCVPCSPPAPVRHHKHKG